METSQAAEVGDEGKCGAEATKGCGVEALEQLLGRLEVQLRSATPEVSPQSRTG